MVLSIFHLSHCILTISWWRTLMFSLGPSNSPSENSRLPPLCSHSPFFTTLSMIHLAWGSMCVHLVSPATLQGQCNSELRVRTPNAKSQHNSCVKLAKRLTLPSLEFLICKMGSEAQPQRAAGNISLTSSVKNYAWYIVGSLKSKNFPSPSLLEGRNVFLSRH